MCENDYIFEKEDVMDYRKTAQEIYDHIGRKENLKTLLYERV